MPETPDPLVSWLAARDALTVAPALLGGTITTTTDAGPVTVRITETEAYLGQRDSAAPDPGAHAFRGRTARNAVLFGPAGHLYVYFTYGMHHCANVVCGQDGVATGVLLRAGEVVDGLPLARRRRDAGRSADTRSAPDWDLARGPARLARALGLHLRDNGVPIAPGVEDPRSAFDEAADPVRSVRVQLAGPAPDGHVSTGPRVGVSGPGGSADYPWRFWLTDDPTVSPYRPAVQRRRVTR
ncbi:putative 3-methyladenine DNA glycosylase [Tersicoccus solisilvae]|uniref:Putative 3-methyladenine DNA glycosylase n=1 Tax=Tersicoccus solisilvae TaxID=1882339 RepID=A0ABQ1PEY1_9MICC|nr:DNA-3-methyladenine glycosylase [Tersicoccus solisilvae]GGC95849.1 putative 3-methyladenine DNA glycosylase [Tersicoccus solisilvae]